MKKLILVLALVLSMGYFTKSKDTRGDFEEISYSDIQRINPDFIIDWDMLMYPPALEHAARSLYSKSRSIYQPHIYETHIKFLINSPGGIVGSTLNFIDRVNRIKAEKNIKIVCYVKKAMSAAFTLMVGICDKTIAMEGVVLMQHTAFNQAGEKTIGAKLLSLEMVRAECEKLKTDCTKWLNVTRIGKDKYFTKKEMKEYKLINEFESTRK